MLEQDKEEEEGVESCARHARHLSAGGGGGVEGGKEVAGVVRDVRAGQGGGGGGGKEEEGEQVILYLVKLSVLSKLWQCTCDLAT